MKTRHFLALALTLAIGSVASADDAAFLKERLGEDYAAAAPGDKLVKISIAVADKKFKDYKERKRAQAEVDAVVLAEVKKAEGSKARLEVLGALRKEATDKVKEISKERRKEKKSYASFMEPSSSMQGAIAMSYVADAAGAQPSIDALGCLKLVRDSTSWSSTGGIVLAYVTDALARDEAYSKADHAGKLAIIKKVAVDLKAVSDQERKYLDQAVLSDWISTELKAGKSPGDLLIAVEDLKKKQMICWFASTWASGYIKELANVR